MWNPESYDSWYHTFQGAVEDRVDWELLRRHLPQKSDSTILDAGGGTGRIALRLAKMGYSVTLCDISPEMLDCAGKKMIRAGVSDRVTILECDNRDLRFLDGSFDLVICWDGAFEARKELVRVTKTGGRISAFLVSKWNSVIQGFRDDSDAAILLAESSPSYSQHHEEKCRVVCPQEARSAFESEGIDVVAIYAVCGWADVLGFPDEVLESREWDNKLFEQTTRMALLLSEEPSVMGMTNHLVLYGNKI